MRPILPSSEEHKAQHVHICVYFIVGVLGMFSAE